MNEGSQQLSRVYLLQPKFHVEGYLQFSSYDFFSTGFQETAVTMATIAYTPFASDSVNYLKF